MFTTIFPIITTPDLERALGFYRDQLDGRVTYEVPGPDGQAVYAGLELGSGELGIGRDAELKSEASPRFSLWVYADDCDAAVERLRNAGVTVLAEPAEQPWGERVAQVQDPDGNVVYIGQPET
jgi:lactoylglutathione lyase